MVIGTIQSAGRYRVKKTDVALSRWRKGEDKKRRQAACKQGHLDQHRK